MVFLTLWLYSKAYKSQLFYTDYYLKYAHNTPPK